MSVMPLEKRSHRRLPLAVGGCFSFDSGIAGWFIRQPKYDCVTSDVSMTGMKLVASSPIPEGSKLKLWVTSPQAGSDMLLKLCGRVCWTTVTNGTGEVSAGVSLDSQGGSGMSVWAEAIRQRLEECYR